MLQWRQSKKSRDPCWEDILSLYPTFDLHSLNRSSKGLQRINDDAPKWGTVRNRRELTPCQEIWSIKDGHLEDMWCPFGCGPLCRRCRLLYIQQGKASQLLDFTYTVYFWIVSKWLQLFAFSSLVSGQSGRRKRWVKPRFQILFALFIVKQN